jgi:hypothetical protein
MRTARVVDGFAVDAAAADAQVAQVPLVRARPVRVTFELPPKLQRVQLCEWQLPQRALVRAGLGLGLGLGLRLGLGLELG